ARLFSWSLELHLFHQRAQIALALLGGIAVLGHHVIDELLLAFAGDAYAHPRGKERKGRRSAQGAITAGSRARCAPVAAVELVRAQSGIGKGAGGNERGFEARRAVRERVAERTRNQQARRRSKLGDARGDR